MVEITPIAVSLIAAIGTITVGYFTYHSGRKTTRRVSDMPKQLVSEFAKLNPGVDTVEKVIDLLYAEIERLKRATEEKDRRIDILIRDKEELLNEIGELKDSVRQHRVRLEVLEERIKSSIGDNGAPASKP